MRPIRALFLLLIAFALPAAAEEARPKVLRVSSFEGEGLKVSEADALRSLVTSYVIELKMFRVIDSEGQELALKEAETAIQLGQAADIAPLAADYILGAKAGLVGSTIVFTLSVTKVSTGEKKSVSDTFQSVNDLILASRRMTRSLFDKTDASASGGQAPGTGLGGPATPLPDRQAGPSLNQIAGTWKGDKNVDRVTILPDGRGYALLASGVRMTLRATIEGSSVIVAQNQPNSPDFYRPSLDARSARTVAQGARPWRWVFGLSIDGKTLSGMKESVFVTVSEKGQVSLDNNYVREALWTKLIR
jgi:hypothetical protein